MNSFRNYKFRFNQFIIYREKATTLDIGTRLVLESEQLLSKTHKDKISHTNSENQECQAKFLPGRHLMY